MRTSIALLFFLAISVLLLGGCGAAKETSLEKLVPAGSSLIASVQVAEILKDTGFETLYKEVPKVADDPQTLNGLLDRVTKEIGVDLRQFSSVTFFADLSQLDKDPPLGLIARGSFEENVLVSAIKRVVGAILTTTEYKGHQIHADEEENIALSLLGSDTLVLGTPSAVRSVIDVQEGDLERASGSVYDAFNDLGDVLVRLALKVPPEVTQGLGRLPSDSFPIPIDLSILRDIDIVGLAVDKEGETIRVEVRADFTSESSAANFGDVIDGLVKVLKGLSPDEKTRQLVNKVRVSVEKRRLSVLLETNVTELGDLIGALVGVSSIESGREEVIISREEVIIPPREVTAVPVPVPAPRPRGVVPGIGTPVLIMGAEHIPVGETANHSTTPPTSGPHWPATAQCGIYDEGLPDELIVHNMEHGHVVISYNLPDPDELSKLRRVVKGLPGQDIWVVARPYSKIKPGTVALTAWGVIDQFDGVDTERIRRFYDAYHRNTLSAETRARGPIPCR